MLSLSLVLLTMSIGQAEKARAPKEHDFPAIDDAARLFSDEARSKATERIREIKKPPTAIDLFVETTNQPPPAGDEKHVWLTFRKKRLRNETLDKAAFDKADDMLARRQAQTEHLPEGERAKFDGIYVLIVADGAGIREVGIAPLPASRGSDDEVSWVKREALRALLLRKEAKDNPDHALDELVALFRFQQTKTFTQPSPLGPNGSPWPALLIVAGMVGVWLALLFVRWRVNEAAAATPGAPEPLLIYQPAMMGTLFGVPAAFWVNDELFRSLPPVVPPPTKDPDSFSLPPMPELPPPGAVTQGTTEPFTLPTDVSGQPPTS